MQPRPSASPARSHQPEVDGVATNPNPNPNPDPHPHPHPNPHPNLNPYPNPNPNQALEQLEPRVSTEELEDLVSECDELLGALAETDASPTAGDPDLVLAQSSTDLTQSSSSQRAPRLSKRAACSEADRLLGVLLGEATVPEADTNGTLRTDDESTVPPLPPAFAHLSRPADCPPAKRQRN